MLITLNRVRASHLYCFEPYTGKPSPQIPNPKPVFKSDFLMAPTHSDLATVVATIEKVGSECQWKGGLAWAQVKEVLKANNAICLKKGDLALGQDEYKGLLYVKGSNKTRFTVLDGDKKPLVAADGRPYSGCIVNAIVDIWAQDNDWGRRINCTITGIQFVEHGAAFGGGVKVASADEFAVVAASADAPPPSGAADPLAGLA